MFQSEYKVPRLKQGTIPTLFGGRSRLATPTISAVVNVKREDLPQKEENSAREEPNKESEPVATGNEVLTSPVQIKNPPELKYLPLEPPAFSFDAIFSDDIAIDLPSSWSRRNIVSPLGLQAVQFSQWTCRKEGNGVKTICQKEIVMGKNLIVHLCVMGHAMKLEEFNVPTEPLSCASDLEKILKIIDQLKVCNGCVFPAENLDTETKFTYKDNAGQVRHKNCPMLLNVIKTCEHCVRGRSTLQRKRRRLESATNNNTQRFRLELSTRKKRKMELLRKQKKKQKSAK